VLLFSTHHTLKHPEIYFFEEEKKKRGKQRRRRGKVKRNQIFYRNKVKSKMPYKLKNNLPTMSVSWFSGRETLVKGFSVKESCELQ
jgi:hypothetical protein